MRAIKTIILYRNVNYLNHCCWIYCTMFKMFIIICTKLFHISLTFHYETGPTDIAKKSRKNRYNFTIFNKKLEWDAKFIWKIYLKTIINILYINTIFATTATKNNNRMNKFDSFTWIFVCSVCFPQFLKVYF